MRLVFLYQFVSKTTIVDHKLGSKVRILGKRTPSKKALFFKIKALPILI